MADIDPLSDLIRHFSLDSLKRLNEDSSLKSLVQCFSEGKSSLTLKGVQYSLLHSDDVEEFTHFISEVFSEQNTVCNYLSITSAEIEKYFMNEYYNLSDFLSYSIVAIETGTLVGALHGSSFASIPHEKEPQDETERLYKIKEEPVNIGEEVCVPFSLGAQGRVMCNNMLAVGSGHEGRGIGSTLLALSMTMAGYYEFEHYAAFCMSPGSAKLHGRFCRMFPEVRYSDIAVNGRKLCDGCPDSVCLAWADLTYPKDTVQSYHSAVYHV